MFMRIYVRTFLPLFWVAESLQFPYFANSKIGETLISRFLNKTRKLQKEEAETQCSLKYIH